MKNVKRIVAGVLALAMVIPMTACSKSFKFEAIKGKDVVNALKEFDCDDDGWYGYYGTPNEYMDDTSIHSCFDASEYDYSRVIAGRLEENTMVVYYEFDDEEDAYDYFTEMVYEVYQDLKDDKDIDGKIYMKNSEGFGYVIMNAVVDDDVIIGDTGYNSDYDFDGCYGGIYYVDDMVLIVMNYDDNEDDDIIDEVNGFLDELEYPHL